MSYDINNVPKVLAVYLELSEYPILARGIREQMRRELFARGIISREQFEREVRAKAVSTQQREGLSDPFGQETAEEWDERLRIVREHLTDFYFALNLPHTLLEEIVRAEIGPRKPGEQVILTFNPELAPWHILFSQAEAYEKLSPEGKDKIRHHLQEIIVVIVRGMISDQLDFLGVARRYLDIFDLKEIYGRRIGRGKIGGKAAGLMLAHKVLQQHGAEHGVPIEQNVIIPDSYFIGADVFYDFLSHNELFRFSNQKYKPRDEIEADYEEVRRHYLAGRFPEDVVVGLAQIVQEVGNSPLIVRSSSLLEDNFGQAFAGKYDSIFCPNQGSPAANLEALLDAIRRVYASTLNPDALLYRQKVGLVDYDERMAVLIQRVQGSRHGHFLFPTVAGVAFGRNPFRWNPRIRLEDGFMRIVLGLGTRAVDRVANDYPRMVALSHPQLRPEVTAAEVRKYSQHFVDVIDLEDNALKTLPFGDVIGSDYPSLELLASVDEGDYVRPMLFRQPHLAPETLVLTFDRLLKEKAFVELMKAILQALDEAYGRPVDIEFTVEIVPASPHPRYVIHLLQCRPLSRREDMVVRLPEYISPGDLILASSKLVPDGVVQRIEYVVYVDPRAYNRVPDYTTKYELGRVVGRLNKRLEGHCYILIGPGRWGSSNVDLGIHVTYADIYNTSMLIELALNEPGGSPEVSYGTHFFQDLVEANIYPLPLYPDEEEAVFNRAFFEDSPNALSTLLPKDKAYAPYVRVIDVKAATGGRLLEVAMSADEQRALGYLRDYEE